MEDKAIDGQNLLDYLGGFNSEHYRKHVLEAIISDKLFKKFLSTPEGRKATEFFTKRISDDVSSIIQIAMTWDADIAVRSEKIILLGTRAGVALSAMRDMVSQMAEGDKHIKAMKKEK